MTHFERIEALIRALKGATAHRWLRIVDNGYGDHCCARCGHTTSSPETFVYGCLPGIDDQGKLSVDIANALAAFEMGEKEEHNPVQGAELMTQKRSPYDGDPYYCSFCGVGLNEYYACEDVRCELETKVAAQERKAKRESAPAEATQGAQISRPGPEWKTLTPDQAVADALLHSAQADGAIDRGLIIDAARRLRACADKASAPLPADVQEMVKRIKGWALRFDHYSGAESYLLKSADLLEAQAREIAAYEGALRNSGHALNLANRNRYAAEEALADANERIGQWVQRLELKEKQFNEARAELASLKEANAAFAVRHYEYDRQLAEAKKYVQRLYEQLAEAKAEEERLRTSVIDECVQAVEDHNLWTLPEAALTELGKHGRHTLQAAIRRIRLLATPQKEGE